MTAHTEHMGHLSERMSGGIDAENGLVLDLFGESSQHCFELGVLTGDNPIIGYINTFYILGWNEAG